MAVHVFNEKALLSSYFDSAIVLCCEVLVLGAYVEYVQLDCLLVRSWDPVITFAVEVRFQIQNQFWIPQPKLHKACYLTFCKTPKHAHFGVFQGILGTQSIL